MEELNKRKRELEQRLRHMPTDSLKAKLLENVKVGGEYKIFSRIVKLIFCFAIDVSAFSLPPEMQGKVRLLL